MQKKMAGEQFTVPIGPQHPALEEPAHFSITVDGEIVTNAFVRLGYAHRGIEKAAEERNWVQTQYLLERICGICSHIHSTAYCLGVENWPALKPLPGLRLSASWSLNWKGSTAICCGWEWLLMKRDLIHFLCTAGGIEKALWISWKD